MKGTLASEITRDGRMILIYSDTGVGKTTSILQSAPLPIAFIQTEPRSLRPSIEAAGRPELESEMTRFTYEDVTDLLEFLNNGENLAEFKGGTIALDSLSFLMNISLAEEITDEAYEARDTKKKGIKQLASLTKMTLEGQGVRNSLMFRITKALMRYSASGFTVIVTALLADKPKWDRALSAAPALSAKEYPINMPGYFDLIGKVRPRTDKEGVIVYPPFVDFEPDGTFVAKFTGVGKRRSGALNFKNILKASS